MKHNESVLPKHALSRRARTARYIGAKSNQIGKPSNTTGTPNTKSDTGAQSIEPKIFNPNDLESSADGESYDESHKRFPN